jgi:beta-lactamase class A
MRSLTRRWAARLAAGVTAGLVLVTMAGCSPSGHGRLAAPTSHPSSTPTPANSSPPTSAGQPASIQATSVGSQLQWLLRAVNARSGPTMAELQAHLTAEFLTAAPAGRVIATIAAVRAGGPLQLQGFISNTGSSGQASVTQPGGHRYLITLATDTSGKITGLLLKPARSLPTVATPGQFQQAAQQAGVWSTVLVATAGPNDGCLPQQMFGDQGPHPLGSMFKLYVLAAVERAVNSGVLTWATPLTVTEQVKSLPSGQLQNVPDGTRVTVQQAATLMISISDNTAADLLIHAVGQRALQAAVAGTGNTHPHLLDPLLTTRQMFTLADDNPAIRQQWAAALPGVASDRTGAVAEPSAGSIHSRAALLTRLPDAVPTVTTTNPRPGWLDGIEWYASPADICHAQVTLHQLSHTAAGAPLGAILSKNPLVAVGPGWAYVGYKGGEDTGVLTGSWYLQPSTGPATVLILQLSTADPALIPDDFWFAAAATGLIQHLPR